MLNIQKIHPKIKWFPVSRRGRPLAILMVDSLGLANWKNYAHKIHQINYQVKYYRQFEAARWISQRDHDNLVKIFERKMRQNPAFLYRASQKIEKKGLRIIKAVDKYKNINWAKLTNKELAKTLEKFHDLESQLWGGPWFYGYYFFFNDIYLVKFKEILEKKLKDDFEKGWNHLITPEKITFIGQEKIALLKLAQASFKNKKIAKDKIEAHLKKFAFVKKYYFWGRGFTFKEIEKRVRELMKKGRKYIEEELKASKQTTPDLDKLPLSKNEKLIIKGFRKIAYASNFADEVTNYYVYHLRGLFDEMARRLKVAYEELVSMRFQEMQESLQNNKLAVPRTRLKQRIKDHALVFARDKVYVLSGQDLKEYRKIYQSKEKIGKIKELKGTVAFRGGKIKGKTRIIASDKQVKYFQKGEILVTQMTNPTYLPAIQKASAIVTDEGGLLCHAAIVSRELKIPCIIGTKIATKALKDGMVVEVDADKGAVKIIK